MCKTLSDKAFAKLPKADAAVCQNCDWQGHTDDLDPINDVDERTSEGDTVWAGDCPECGAMCFTMAELDRQQKNDAAIAERQELRAALADLREWNSQQGTYEAPAWERATALLAKVQP
jgi:hypothetical protein